MVTIFSIIALTKFLIIPLAIILFFGIRNKEEKIHSISWSVPVPPDLLSHLREFSPVAISRASGIYLDDVFDFLKGERARTSPEVIKKFENALEKLRKHDEDLEREAAKMAYMIRGLDAIEQREQAKYELEKRLSRSKKT